MDQHQTIVLKERTLEVFRQPEGLVSVGIGDGQEPIRMRPNEAADLIAALALALASNSPTAT